MQKQNNELNIHDLAYLSDRDITLFFYHKFKYKKTLIDSHYYVDFGKTYFGLASEHNMARQLELDDILHSLSEGFEVISKLLQYMRNEYLVSSKLKIWYQFSFLKNNPVGVKCL